MTGPSSSMPFAPMLPTARDPERDLRDWFVEMKWDGVRTIVDARAGSVRLWSRRSSDITASFADVAQLVGSSVNGAVVLDGELVVVDESGRPDFSLVQRRLGAQARGGSSAALLLFDILLCGGSPCIDQPYEQRRELLESVIAQHPRVLVPPVYTRDVDAGIRLSRQHGLEGVVAKRPGSRYVPGARTRDWIKVVNLSTIEAVVVGFLLGTNGSLASLVLAVPTPDGRLRYAGRVSSGLTHEERTALHQVLAGVVSASPPVTDAPADVRPTWTDPVVVVEVAMADWTRDGRLRHPRWRGLRLDKRVGDVAPPS